MRRLVHEDNWKELLEDSHPVNQHISHPTDLLLVEYFPYRELTRKQYEMYRETVLSKSLP
ncbi:MAG: hypothetical protein AABX48_03585 [Nanoarchaeota archaeon]